MTQHHVARVKVTAQAGRILGQCGFDCDGTDLAALLDVGEERNRPALETWIAEVIERNDLEYDHTLSAELDRLLAPLIRYAWPERHYPTAA
ncbi:MAG: hypothetical protein RQ729_11320 [Wenzhouxiangellaceae bacterium]|nr:hypothetical protein [Wenzhouxiangellaceae bacterium]